MFRKRGIFTFGMSFVLFAGLFLSNILLAQNDDSYDPWMDLNDDGIIDATDLQLLAVVYSTLGTPINKTARLLELEARIDSLNTSLLSMEARTTTLESKTATLETEIAELQSRVDDLEADVASLSASHVDLESRVSELEASANGVESTAIEISSQSTESSSWTGLGSSLEVNCSNGKLLIILSGHGRILASPSGPFTALSDYRILLDGGQVGSDMMQLTYDTLGFPDLQTPVSIIRLVNVTAGIHIIQAQFKSISQGVHWYGGSLIVFEFGE